MSIGFTLLIHFNYLLPTSLLLTLSLNLFFPNSSIAFLLRLIWRRENLHHSFYLIKYQQHLLKTERYRGSHRSMIVFTNTLSSEICSSRGVRDTWMVSKRDRNNSSLCLYTLLYTLQTSDSTILTKMGGSLLDADHAETVLFLAL